MKAGDRTPRVRHGIYISSQVRYVKYLGSLILT